MILLDYETKTKSMLEFYYADNGQPHADFEWDDEILDLNWVNTTIYAHRKPYQEIDHLFYVEFDDEGVAMHGMYLFRQMVPNFTQVAKQLAEAYYRHMIAPLPAPGDLEAWVEYNTRDLDE